MTLEAIYPHSRLAAQLLTAQQAFTERLTQCKQTLAYLTAQRDADRQVMEQQEAPRPRGSLPVARKPAYSIVLTTLLAGYPARRTQPRNGDPRRQKTRQAFFAHEACFVSLSSPRTVAARATRTRRAWRYKRLGVTHLSRFLHRQGASTTC